jgi:hypothetical protein
VERPVGESDLFDTYAEYGLYLKALDWCVRESGRYVPAEWVIPDSVIAAWGARRTANRLVASGIWSHDDYAGRFHFAYIAKQNDPGQLRDTRKKARERKARQRRLEADVPLGQAPMSRGESHRDIDSPSVSRKGEHVRPKNV